MIGFQRNYPAWSRECSASEELGCSRPGIDFLVWYGWLEECSKNWCLSVKISFYFTVAELNVYILERNRRCWAFTSEFNHRVYVVEVYFKNSTSVSSPCVQTIKMSSIYLSQTTWNLRFVRVILQRFPFEIPHEQLTLRGWSNLCVYSCTMSLYKMFMIACRQIVHGSVQSCGCRITNGFCRIEQICQSFG